MYLGSLGILGITTLSLNQFALPLQGKLFNSEDNAVNWLKPDDTGNLDTCQIEDKFNSSQLTKCLSSKAANDGPTKENIYLIGDSHARNYLSAIKTAYPNANVMHLTIGHGCSILPISQITRIDHITNCSDYNLSIQSFLLNHKNQATVFIGQKITVERSEHKYFKHIDNFSRSLTTRG